jgi:DNA-binding PucR family transcriptional regulator
LAEAVIGGTVDGAGIVAGISSGAWTAHGAARAYGEAVRALRIPLSDPTAAAIGSWDHAGAFRALTLLPVAGDPDPIDPRVRALLAHPQLARTVATFLDNAGDAGTTARQLQIHRATLYQRLTRVSDLCALDIQRSGDDRLAAHIGVRFALLARSRPSSDDAAAGGHAPAGERQPQG